MVGDTAFDRFKGCNVSSLNKIRHFVKKNVTLDLLSWFSDEMLGSQPILHQFEEISFEFMMITLQKSDQIVVVDLILLGFFGYPYDLAIVLG